MKGTVPSPVALDDLHLMRAPEAKTLDAQDLGAAVGMPLRLLLRFADTAYELRFVKHYVAFYFRYAQVSLLLGVLLIAGDYLVDRIAHTDGPANLLRLTTAVPVLRVGLGYSLLPKARRHWQPVMAQRVRLAMSWASPGNIAMPMLADNTIACASTAMGCATAASRRCATADARS